MRALLMVLAIVAIAALPASAQGKAPAAGAKALPVAKTPAAPGSVVNLNTATLAQLEALPGLGAAVARRILDYREKNGNFKKVEDLMNVKGIGEKSFLKLKPLVTVTQKADPPGVPDRQAQP
jgi:competence protein ComEA